MQLKCDHWEDDMPLSEFKKYCDEPMEFVKNILKNKEFDEEDYEEFKKVVKIPFEKTVEFKNFFGTNVEMPARDEDRCEKISLYSIYSKMARTKNSYKKHQANQFDVRDHDTKRSKLDVELARLYKSLASAKNRKQVEEEINQKVRDFNKSNPKHVNYYDLHGMTKTGAILYVAEIVEKARGIGTIVRLETGKGIHSKDNVPVIRNHLLAFYSSVERCTIYPDGNFWKFSKNLSKSIF